MSVETDKKYDPKTERIEKVGNNKFLAHTDQGDTFECEAKTKKAHHFLSKSNKSIKAFPVSIKFDRNGKIIR